MAVNINASIQTDFLKHEPLCKEKASHLFSLYTNFFDSVSSNYPSISLDLEFMKREFSDINECAYEWQKLDVYFPIGHIENVLKTTGILPLRPVPKDSKILIIGCGNKPITNAGGDPISEDDGRYVHTHTHEGAITIDPFLATNPTLVGFFGAQEFPMLESKQFDLIVIEGTSIFDTIIGRKELARLLSPKGQVVSNFGGSKGLEFTWEDNAKSFWDDRYVEPTPLINDLNAYSPAFNYPR